MNLIFIQITVSLVMLILTFTGTTIHQYVTTQKDDSYKAGKVLALLFMVPLELKAMLFHRFVKCPKALKRESTLSVMRKLLALSKREILIHFLVTTLSLIALIVTYKIISPGAADLGKELPTFTNALLYNGEYAMDMIFVQLIMQVVLIAVVAYVSALLKFDALTQRCLKISLRAGYIVLAGSSLFLIISGTYLLHHMAHNPI